MCLFFVVVFIVTCLCYSRPRWSHMFLYIWLCL